MKYEPREYQKAAIKRLLAEQHHGLLIEPGLGKTSITLEAFRLLRKADKVGSALVVAPLRVINEVWPREMEKWDSFKAIRYRILHGKDKSLDDSKDVDVWLINPEGLEWLARQLHLRGRWPFEWLIVDESTKFKHANSQRSKLLKNMLPHFIRRTILTGTPTPNGMMDLFGQIMIVDCGKSLGRFITHYRNEFFYQTGFGGFEWRLQDGARERILERIKPITTTLLAEDHLPDLPKRVDNKVLIDLPAKALKFYKDLEEELIAELEGGKLVSAKHAGIASAKCRQVCNGGIYDDERVAQELHEAKVDAVEDLVEELQGSPLLVLYQFKHDLERLRKRFPKAPYLRGNQPAAETRRNLDAWNNGQCEVLLAQSDVVYHGLNMQEGPGHTIAWFGLTWDYEVFDQCIKRLLRSGQKSKRVVVHYLLMRNTIEETMYQIVVGAKAKSQMDFLKALRTDLSTRRRS